MSECSLRISIRSHGFLASISATMSWHLYSLEPFLQSFAAIGTVHLVHANHGFSSIQMPVMLIHRQLPSGGGKVQRTCVPGWKFFILQIVYNLVYAVLVLCLYLLCQDDYVQILVWYIWLLWFSSFSSFSHWTIVILQCETPIHSLHCMWHYGRLRHKRTCMVLWGHRGLAVPFDSNMSVVVKGVQPFNTYIVLLGGLFWFNLVVPMNMLWDGIWCSVTRGQSRPANATFQTFFLKYEFNQFY